MRDKDIWKLLAISIVLLMVINCITPSIAVGNLNDNALNRSVEAMMPFYASANATIYANQIPFYHSRINDEGNYHLSSVVMHVNVNAQSEIGWHDQGGMQIAKSQNKPTMILFYSDRCPACVKLTGEFADTRVINISKKFVPIVGSRVLDSQYGIRYVPTIVFTNSQGMEVHRIVGYRDADTLVNGMQYALSLSTTLNVPFFSQRDPAWCDKKLDHSPYSIGEYGSALTSAAMVAKYFGYDTDPGRLNTSLTEVGGLDTSGILYRDKVEEVSDGKVEWIGRAEGNWSKIDQELSKKNPVIADVSCSRGNHFIVFIGNIRTEYYFLDPYDKTRTVNKWPNGAHGEYTLNNLRIYHKIPIILQKGDSILFHSNRDNNFEIYVMDADGTNQTRLTRNMGNDQYAVWSPDSSKIAFTSEKDGNEEIYVMNPDGRNQRRLTCNSASDWIPDFSPDGKKIAFTSNRDGNNEIYIMNLDGSNQLRLTENDADDRDSDWSITNKIAFESNRDGNPEIYIMNADGTYAIRLTDNNAVDRHPAWSPDGSKIAFTSNRDGNDEIYVMNANGGNQTRITHNSVSDLDPVWSPNGNYIAFASNREIERNYEIYVMNANGSNQTRLTVNTNDDYRPDWGLPTPTPASGKGIWIWKLSEAERGNVSAIIERCKNVGIEWVAIKGGDGTQFWNWQCTPSMITQFQNAGIKVLGWQYVYGDDPIGEASVANQILNAGVDGFIIDAEGEYEGKTDNATIYLENIREEHPNRFIAYTTFPIIDYHKWFPYLEFGKYCDAVMPQDYWKEIGVTLEEIIDRMEEQWNKWHEIWEEGGYGASIKPIIPLGQGWDVSGSEITRFCNLVYNRGYGGISLWRYETMTVGNLEAYAECFIPQTSKLLPQEVEIKTKVEAGETIIQYENRSFWKESDFLNILKNKEEFEFTSIKNFDTSLSKYGEREEYAVNANIEFEEDRNSTVFRSDIHEAVRKNDNSYRATFKWLLTPLGLDFVDDNFKESKNGLSWEGTINSIPTNISLKFPLQEPVYAAWQHPVGHCHAHVWWTVDVLKNIRFGYQSSTHQIVHINATEYNKAHPDEAAKIFARETECDVEKVKESCFILEKGESYNHTIRAGSHPQIHHRDALSTANGWINCTEFTEANGKCYNDWISAIKLFL